MRTGTPCADWWSPPYTCLISTNQFTVAPPPCSVSCSVIGSRSIRRGGESGVHGNPKSTSRFIIQAPYFHLRLVAPQHSGPTNVQRRSSCTNFCGRAWRPTKCVSAVFHAFSQRCRRESGPRGGSRRRPCCVYGCHPTRGRGSPLNRRIIIIIIIRGGLSDISRRHWEPQTSPHSLKEEGVGLAVCHPGAAGAPNANPFTNRRGGPSGMSPGAPNVTPFTNRRGGGPSNTSLEASNVTPFTNRGGGGA